MTSAIHGPGILFVRSRISPSASSILSEQTFLQWYDEEHIAEVVSTSGIKSGFRYIDTAKTSPCGDATNPKPYLAFYPMEDLTCTLGDEFRKIGFKSDKLPGTGIVYDLADLDVSYLGLVGKMGNGRDRAEYVVTCGVRPQTSQKDSERLADEVLARQMKVLEDIDGYMRSMTFELQYARTNAQSRKLKGLPTTDEPSPEPSTKMKMHELRASPDVKVMEEVRSLCDEVDGEWEVFVWRHDKSHGDAKLFE